MPSKSKAQHNLMAAVANNPKFAKKAGIPQTVGADYMKADKGKKYNMGGMAKKKVRAAPDAPSMTVRASPRIMSALPPRQSTKSADVQGERTSSTARSVTGTKRNIDGIARQGKTRAIGQS
jgi:hypothetical protein